MIKFILIIKELQKALRRQEINKQQGKGIK